MSRASREAADRRIASLEKEIEWLQQTVEQRTKDILSAEETLLPLRECLQRNNAEIKRLRAVLIEHVVLAEYGNSPEFPLIGYICQICNDKGDESMTLPTWEIALFTTPRRMPRRRELSIRRAIDDMNEMIERVARAIDPWAWCELNVDEAMYQTRQKASVLSARRVILAMREPTKEMADAIRLLRRPVGRAEYIVQYQNMIDGALS